LQHHSESVRKEAHVAGHFADASPLRHHLSTLQRGLWIVVLTAAAATALAVFLSERQRPLYRASSAVFLNTQNLAATLSNVSLPYTDPTRLAQTQSDLARLPAVAERAAAAARVGRTADDLLGESSVSTTTNSDLLSFSVTDRERRVAARLATSYARAYTGYRRQLDTNTLVRARNEIEQRMAELVASRQRGTSLYRDLADKDQQLRTMELLMASNAQVVRPAVGTAQVQPRPTRNAVLGFVLGLVLGLGLVFLRDTLDTRIRNSAEVEERLGLPLLGRLPEPPRRLRARDALIMLESPAAAEAESFRILATNLDFVNLDRQARTIMITSAVGGEGKSTTAANLAVALARAGRRVVLVDLDLRRPNLERFFVPRQSPTVGAPGLTHIILGRATLDQALMPVPILDSPDRETGNGAVSGLLEVLTAGPVVSNTAQFFASQALGDLLARLEERADVVLIDSSPLLHVSDTIALSAKVDALVVVTNLRIVRRPVLNELARVLDSAPVVKLGFVVAGAKAEEAYGYGYGYGYREAARERSRREWVR
jgi:capsular exopolysaccharide synthesis family protein